MNAIEIVDLSKQYGARLAVDHLTLSIQEGNIYGFVGPNGAGKTSTIRMMAGLLQSTSGEIFINGHSVLKQPEMVKQQIGYMPDYFGVYPDLKVREYLEFFSACYQIPQSQRPSLIDDLLGLVDLAHRSDDPVDRLSRGMKQRLSLSRTLIHDPKVLILDEPASGLDPRARVEIRELMVELSRMGKTIFFSTHILGDVAEICSRVGIIEAGRLVAEGTLDELHLQIMPRRLVEVALLDQAEQAQQIVSEISGVEAVEIQTSQNERDHTHLTFEFNGDDRALSAILASLVGAQIPVLHFRENNLDLEEVFMRTTRGIVS
jgi:ABC-2 type transport system ATP-binding protein